MQTEMRFDKKTSPSIVKAIKKAFDAKEKRKWNKIYFFFDIHETILYPDYNNTDPKKFYPHAKEVLQYLSKRPDIEMGLYTCSYPNEITGYLTFFQEQGIKFHHINRNLSISDTVYGFYKEKPYFSVLFEDKAGFDAESDWFEVRDYFDLDMQ